jgi:AraC-like DNA-binding protein
MRTLWRATDEPLATRWDYWQHVLDDILVPTDVRGVGDARPWLHDQLRSSDFGAVRVNEVTTSWVTGAKPAAVVRTPQHIRRSDPDIFKVEMPVAGQILIDQADRQARLRPGDLGIVNPSLPCRWAVSSRSFIVVTFPRALLPLNDDDVVRLTGGRIVGTDGPGALVSSLTRHLATHHDDYDVSQATRIGTALLDLLTVALYAAAGRPDLTSPDVAHRALLLDIYAFIEERLADPTLSPHTIAAHHHISVRHLHKLFETQNTTVMGWIRQRRLELCRRDLLDPALRSRPVGTIAARRGFAEATHFSRAFRRAYGMAPAEFRSAYNQPGLRAPARHALIDVVAGQLSPLP